MQRHRPAGLLLVLAASVAGAARPAATPPQRAATELLVTLAPAPAPRTARAAPLLPERPQRQRLTVAPGKPVATVVRQRDPALSEQQLVVITLDGSQRELSRTVIADPRLVRAETTTADGQLTTADLWRASVSFRVVVPANPEAVELRLLQPRWDGRRMLLELIGSARLR